jgi:hypothetical protein
MGTPRAAARRDAPRDPRVGSGRVRHRRLRNVVHGGGRAAPPADPARMRVSRPSRRSSRYRSCLKRLVREAGRTKALPPPCLAAVRGCETKSVCGTTSSAVVCCVRKRNGAIASSVKGRASRCRGLACQRPRHAAEVCPAGEPLPVGPFTMGALTVTDRRTGLEWERKVPGRPADLHAEDAVYVWAGTCAGPSSTTSTPCQPTAAAEAACKAQTPPARWSDGCEPCAPADGACLVESASGTVWDWLAQLNAAAFGGHTDWRLPTVAQGGEAAELETIVDPMWSACEDPGIGTSTTAPSPFFGNRVARRIGPRRPRRPTGRRSWSTAAGRRRRATRTTRRACGPCGPLAARHSSNQRNAWTPFAALWESCASHARVIRQSLDS